MTTEAFLCSAEATALFRVLGYVGLALFVGVGFFVAFVWNDGGSTRAVRILLASSIVVGAGGAVGALMCTVAKLEDSMSVEQVLQTPFGRAMVGLVMLWSLATVAVVVLLRQGASAGRRFGWRLLLAVTGGGIIALNGSTAHGAQTSTIGAVADFVHVTAMAVWVGGLLALVVAVLPRRDLAELDRVVPRFSRVAQISVGAVVVSGVAMLWEIAHRVDHFWGSRYGDIVLVKLGVIALTLSAAMLSRRWVLRRLHRADSVPGLRPIIVSLTAESIGAMAVLAAAGTLATSSPGL